MRKRIKQIIDEWGAIGGALTGGFAKVPLGSMGNITSIAGHTVNGFRIAGQMAISTGVYVGQTLSTGGQLTVGGFAFAALGGFGAGSNLTKDASRTVTGLLGAHSALQSYAKHRNMWASLFI